MNKNKFNTISKILNNDSKHRLRDSYFKKII